MYSLYRKRNGRVDIIRPVVIIFSLFIDRYEHGSEFALEILGRNRFEPLLDLARCFWREGGGTTILLFPHLAGGCHMGGGVYHFKKLGQ